MPTAHDGHLKIVFLYIFYLILKSEELLVLTKFMPINFMNRIALFQAGIQFGLACNAIGQNIQIPNRIADSKLQSFIL